MRAEMKELRSDVNDVKSKGVAHVQWPRPHINANAKANAASKAANCATNGQTSGATRRTTIGPTGGAKSGATSDATSVTKSDPTSGVTSGATRGATSGATSVTTSDPTSGATSGAKSGATGGVKSGATSVATSDPTSGATSDARSGATIGATIGRTSGAKSGATSGAKSGPTSGVTSGSSGGETRRTSLSARADGDGYITVARKRASNVDNRQMKRPVIGTRSDGNTLKVSSGRFISIFVSRLDPSVSCDALSAYINDVHSINAKCEQLITKYNSYASFKVDVTCNDMSTFLSPDKWPQGVYLRKFFNNKK